MLRLGGVNKIGTGCFFGGELDVARGVIGQAAGREMPANVLDVFGSFITDRTGDDELLAASVFGSPHANVVRRPLAEEGIERVGEADLVFCGGEGLPAWRGDVIHSQRRKHDDPFPCPGWQFGLHRLQLRQGLVSRHGQELIAGFFLGQRSKSGAPGLGSAGSNALHVHGGFVLPGFLGGFGERRFVRVSCLRIGRSFLRILLPHPHR